MNIEVSINGEPSTLPVLREALEGHRYPRTFQILVNGVPIEGTRSDSDRHERSMPFRRGDGMGSLFYSLRTPNAQGQMAMTPLQDFEVLDTLQGLLDQILDRQTHHGSRIGSNSNGNNRVGGKSRKHRKHRKQTRRRRPFGSI